MPLSVYSIKVNPDHLEGAREFFSRVNMPLQESLRAQIKMASDCEQCLELVDADAPVEQIQSAFAGILADAKKTWKLNGLFREAIIKTARAAQLPDGFISNVMAEAERFQNKCAETKVEE